MDDLWGIIGSLSLPLHLLENVYAFTPRIVWGKSISYLLNALAEIFL